MKLILPVAISALVLAGCTDDFNKTASTSCARPADKQAQWELVAPGVLSLGMDLPTKKRLGIANANQVATTACGHNENNMENNPQIQDLKKVGALVPSGTTTSLD